MFGWLWQALAALLIATVFAAAVAQARSVAPGVRSAQQLLLGNVRSTEGSAAKLNKRRNELATRVDDVQRHALAEDAEGQRLLKRLDALSLAAASTAIIGPGLKVTVTDPGASPNLSDVSKQRVSGSRQIILDRDLQLLVNSLWASGAEAISVGGVRIGPNVTIRQAGGAILVDNNPTSSPYTVLAIGPPRCDARRLRQQPRHAATEAVADLLRCRGYGGCRRRTNASCRIDPGCQVRQADWATVRKVLNRRLPLCETRTGNQA